MHQQKTHAECSYASGSCFWTSKDPSRWKGGANFYAYAQNNPVNFSDPTGLDIWIEGPSGNEPVFHQGIAIGDPFGAYQSFSFTMSWTFGNVYQEADVGGPIEQYMKTTPEQDRQALSELISSIDADNRSVYGFEETCMSYSQSTSVASPSDLGPHLRRRPIGHRPSGPDGGKR
jgi:uncharacterized protein RhaS with RHS repeats